MNMDLTLIIAYSSLISTLPFLIFKLLFTKYYEKVTITINKLIVQSIGFFISLTLIWSIIYAPVVESMPHDSDKNYMLISSAISALSLAIVTILFKKYYEESEISTQDIMIESISFFIFYLALKAVLPLL